MAKKSYDIFISYRRDGGKQYARILQLMLQQRGYKVFLDYDELKDGIFREYIARAIKQAPIFMLVLSEKSLEHCKNEKNWIRKEISLAVSEKKHIIPVNPDKSFDGIPEDAPDFVKTAAGSYHHSDIDFGSNLGTVIEAMIKDRISPIVGSRCQNFHMDVSHEDALKTLERIDAHNRFMKIIAIVGISLIVVISLVTASVILHRQNEIRKQQELDKVRADLRLDLERKHKDFQLHLNKDLSVEQMNIIDTILLNMIEVRQDSLWVSKFEFTVGQWFGLLGKSYDATQKDLPMSEVSFVDVFSTLLPILRQYTGIQAFDLPSTEEWLFAAHGGNYHENTVYVGSDNVDEVAWYQGNSGGKSHPCDGNKAPNWLDLFDMSGNVAEWCNSAFIISDTIVLRTVCGGNYNSSASEVTVNSKAGMNAETQEKTIGFRLIIRKY